MLPMLVAIILPATLLGLYLAGYLCLGNASEGRAVLSPSQWVVVTIDRSYPQAWQRTIFRPAAYVESRLRNIRVTIEDPADIPLKMRTRIKDLTPPPSAAAPPSDTPSTNANSKE